MRLSYRILAVLLPALLLPSCAGYQLGASRPAAMESVRTMAVPVFRNETLLPRSSVLITNRVVRQFQVDGTYQIADAARADAVLRGTLRPLQRRQLRSDKFNTLRTTEQELRLILDYSVETRSGAVITTGSVEGVSSHFLDANYQRSLSQALDDAAARLAEDLVSRLTEGWGSSSLPPAPPPPAPPSSAAALDSLLRR